MRLCCLIIRLIFETRLRFLDIPSTVIVDRLLAARMLSILSLASLGMGLVVMEGDEHGLVKARDFVRLLKHDHHCLASTDILWWIFTVYRCAALLILAHDDHVSRKDLVS